MADLTTLQSTSNMSAGSSIEDLLALSTQLQSSTVNPQRGDSPGRQHGLSGNTGLGSDDEDMPADPVSGLNSSRSSLIAGTTGTKRPGDDLTSQVTKVARRLKLKPASEKLLLSFSKLPPSERETWGAAMALRIFDRIEVIQPADSQIRVSTTLHVCYSAASRSYKFRITC